MSTLITYNHVEDYLELLAGYHPTSVIGTSLTTPTSKLLDVSLARYDVAIVESMAQHTMFGGSLTDKQAELTVALILKYKRQFAKAGIDVSPVEHPIFRKPIRFIDRTKRLEIENEILTLHFPYDKQLISDLNAFQKTSQGHAVFNHNDKVWRFGLTETNIYWLVSWARINNINVSPEVQKLYDLVAEAELTPYEIKLVQTENGLAIVNAADSLVEYINNNLGGFGLDNLVKLIDYAGVLGYTIDEDVRRFAFSKYNSHLQIFGDCRQIYISPTDNAMEAILEYAKAANRYPVCIYDPGLGNEFDFSQFSPTEILRCNYSGKLDRSDYDLDNVKLVYANKIPPRWEHPIPLLVSTVEMMYGGKRMDWLNRAEKVIFLCNTKLKENN